MSNIRHLALYVTPTISSTPLEGPTMSGTITLPSGDKLITQIEILPSGALVHREEVIVSGTISGRLALPTNTEPPLDTFGLPVREISGPKIGVAGTPLRIDPTGTTTQPVSIASPVTVTHPGTIGVIVTSQPSVSFNGPQPISSVAGTVQVAFTPSAVQSVNLLNVGFAGTPLVASISNTPSVTFSGQQPIHGTVIVNSLPPITFASPQAVTVSGSISLPDYARYSEQQSQTTSLGLIDDVIHVINAALGKVAAIGGQRNDSSPTTATEGAIAPPRITSQRAFHFNLRNEAGQEIGTAGTPLRFDPTGTTTQPVSIAASVNIGAVAGTVNVAFTPASTQDVRLMNVGFAGTPMRIDPTGTTTQPISFVGQQPVHGTVVISSMPAIQVTSGTQAYITNELLNISLRNVGFAGTPLVTSFAGTPSVNIADMPPISLSPITFASPQPISTIAGTVAVAFTPAASQNVILTTPTTAGTVLALLSEQQLQTTALQLIDDTVHAANAAFGKTIAIGGQRDDESITLATENAVAPTRITSYRAQHVSLRNEIGTEIGSAGTPLRVDPTGATTQPISFVGQQPIHGTVQVSSLPNVTVSSLPNITFSGQQPVHGTVQVSSIPPITFASPQAVTFSGQQPIHGTVVVSSIPSVAVNSLPSITFASPQPISTVAGTVSVSFPSTQTVSISGTVSIPDYARYSEQITQSTSLSLIDTDVVTIRNAVLGTPGVNVVTLPPISFSSPQAITFSGQQPVHGTVQINGPLGSGIEATAVRVTLASDSTGLISVDDNGGSLTVDGQVNVLLQNYGHSGTPLRVDPTGTTTQPVSFISAQPISTVAGTVAVNVRNSIFTHKTARIDMGGAGNHTVVAGLANRRIKVYAMSANAERGGTVNIAWLDGTSPMSGTQAFVDREGFAMAVSPPAFLLAPQPGTALVAHVGTILNSGGGFRGWVSFWDDDAF